MKGGRQAGPGKPNRWLVMRTGTPANPWRVYRKPIKEGEALTLFFRGKTREQVMDRLHKHYWRVHRPIGSRDLQECYCK